jgi:8-oxo-dGTP diphosphatase
MGEVLEIRTAAKAVIVREGKLLLNHCRSTDGSEYYALPGGGQRTGETLDQTIARECREEIGAEVSVVRLLFVREHVVANHAFSYLHEAPHQVELLFECRIPDEYVPASGPGPDEEQLGVAWLGLEEMRGVRVSPSRLRELLDAAGTGALPFYWGDTD